MSNDSLDPSCISPNFLNRRLWNLKAVKNKAFSAVFALSNVRNLLPRKIKHTIYDSLFRSFEEYGISAWGRNKNPDKN